MKNIVSKEGYFNRKTHDLPKNKTKIEVIVPSTLHGEEVYRCFWIPADNIINKSPKHEGYLGTAEIASGKHAGIGFHAWEQNDSEFIYYKIV